MRRIFGIVIIIVVVSTAGTIVYGQGWMAETMVNTITAGKQASRGTDTPWSLTCDNTGKVHIVWEDRRDQRVLSIYYRGKSASPSWDDWDNQEINISPIDSIDLVGHPSVGALEDGSLISVFVEERISGGELLGTIFPTGLSCWLPPQYISIPGGNSLSFNSTGWQTTIATNGHRAITFWPYIGNELDNFRPIFFRKYDGVGWQGSEVPLPLPNVGLRYYAKNLSAVWARQDTIYLVFACMPENRSIYQINFVKINFSDDCISDYQVIAIDSVVSQEFPYICRQLDKNGRENIYIVYDNHGVNESAQMRYFSESYGAWSLPMKLGDTLISSGYPCVAANPDGTIELAFEQPGNEPTSQVYYQRFNPEMDSLGEPFRVSEGGYFSKRPVIACDKFGNTHIIYISNRIHPWDPGNEEVFYRMMDAAPRPPMNIVVANDTIRWDYDDPPDLRYFQIFAIINGDTILIGGTLNHFFRHNLGADAIIGIRAVDLNWKSSPLVLAEAVTNINSQVGENLGDIEIGPNYPNPFNSYTAFLTPGNLSDKDDAYIEIFDILGAKIKSITISLSSNRAVWDGANQNGIPVASGVYFYRLCKGDRRYSSVHKMILLR
jgi:hypothetical protein